MKKLCMGFIGMIVMLTLVGCSTPKEEEVVTFKTDHAVKLYKNYVSDANGSSKEQSQAYSKLLTYIKDVDVKTVDKDIRKDVEKIQSYEWFNDDFIKYYSKNDASELVSYLAKQKIERKEFDSFIQSLGKIYTYLVLEGEKK